MHRQSVSDRRGAAVVEVAIVAPTFLLFLFVALEVGLKLLSVTELRKAAFKRLGRRGVATVEFALIAPVMITIIFGAIEFNNVFRIQAKVNTAAGQLANLVAGDASVTAPSGTLADHCTGAALNLLPFPKGTLAADIASVTNDHPGNRVSGSTDFTSVVPYVDWENISSCPTAYPTSMGWTGALTAANAPQSLLSSSGAPVVTQSQLAYSYSVIVVQTKYTYTNILSFFLGHSITMTGTAVARPRSNKTIPCANVGGGTACPALQ